MVGTQLSYRPIQFVTSQTDMRVLESDIDIVTEKLAGVLTDDVLRAIYDSTRMNRALHTA
jgi:hypothetical protein